MVQGELVTSLLLKGAWGWGEAATAGAGTSRGTGVNELQSAHLREPPFPSGSLLPALLG